MQSFLKEKEICEYLLVGRELFGSIMGDYTIPSITKSPILDVFPYFTGEEEQLEKFNVLEDSEPTEEEKVEAEESEASEEEVVEETKEV